MEQDLLAKVREPLGGARDKQEEAVEEVVAEAVWEEIVRGQGPVEIVFVRIAAREYSISGECPVIR